METKFLEDYIVVIKDAVCKDLCDKIVSTYKDSDDWELPNAGYPNIKTYPSNDARNCSIIYTSHRNNLHKAFVRQEIDNELFIVAANCITKYKEIFPNCNTSEDSGYDLLKYHTGGYCLSHIDSFSKITRTVSCSMLLNDDYEGGEFAFFDRRIKHSLSKGDVIMFPSNYMYPHEIMPITSGTRYSIITWFK